MTTASYIKQHPRVLAILRDNKEVDIVALTVFGALTLDFFFFLLLHKSTFQQFNLSNTSINTIPLAVQKYPNC